MWGCLKILKGTLKHTRIYIRGMVDRRERDFSNNRFIYYNTINEMNLT